MESANGSRQIETILEGASGPTEESIPVSRTLALQNDGVVSRGFFGSLTPGDN